MGFRCFQVKGCKFFLIKNDSIGISDQSTFNQFISAAVKFTPGKCGCSLPTVKRCNNVWKNLCNCVCLQTIWLCL